VEHEIVLAVRNLVKFIPVVYVEAFLVFLIVGFVKASGLAKKEPLPQLSNAVLSFLFSGGKLPVGDYATQKLFMTMIVAGLMFKVYKFLKGPKPKKLFKKLKEVLDKE
jgi:multisubunit Na+/H+ antiporter MnhF subunit